MLNRIVKEHIQTFTPSEINTKKIILIILL